MGIQSHREPTNLPFLRKRYGSGKSTHSHGYNVSLHGKWIDKVFHTHPLGFGSRAEREEDVRRSLVEHDGYNSAIVVRQERKRP